MLSPREAKLWEEITGELAPDMPKVPGPFRSWFRRNWPGLVVLGALALAAVVVWLGGSVFGNWIRLR